MSPLFPRPLRFAEPLALIHANSNRNARFALGSLGGRWVLFCCIADLGQPDTQAALRQLTRRPLEEGVRVTAVFCADPAGESNDTLRAIARTKLVFTDTDAAKTCGLLEEGRGRWMLFDPSLRLAASWPLPQGDEALDALAQTTSPDDHAGAPLNAPVLIVPRIFEPDFCTALIDYYTSRGGEPSGVTQSDSEGRTFVTRDDGFKRRKDCLIEDARLREAAMHRIYWRLGPEIEKAFMWRPTRMERYLVACYDVASGGFFKPHRDNTTPGTAHRRFAVTINLNAGHYEGGDLRFPEFGSRTYRAPTGGAVVFSCALLHEATPVTRGARYAFLPFLYDEEAAKIRAQNNKHLDESIRPYLS